MSKVSPLVGFGDPDDPANFAPFRVNVTSESGAYPDWEDGGPLGSVRQIAGSSAFDVYNGGFGPSRLTLSIWFASRADYLAFRALYRARTPGTLSLLARFTSHEGPFRVHMGRDYEQYRNTRIERVVEVLHGPHGRVDCTAVFMRAEGD